MDNKILVQSKDTALVSEYISSVCKKLPDYDYRQIYTIDDFSDNFLRSDLFDRKKSIISITLDNSISPSLINFLCVDTDDVLIFLDKGDVTKNKAYNTIKAECKVIKIDKLTVKECISWVTSYLTNNGYKFDMEVPDVLSYMKDGSLDAIKNEITKLDLCYGKYIKKEYIKKLTTPMGETKYFSVGENFSHKKIKETLKEFSEIPEQSYIGLLHYLINHLDKLYKVSIYKEQKMSVEEISDIISIPKFIVKMKFFTAIAAYGKIKIMKMLELLNDLDLQLRLTKHSKKELFEYYLLRCMRA